MYIPDAKEKARLKGLGYLSNKDSARCSARIVTPGGVVTPAQVRVLADAADKFGCGKLSFTTRFAVEIPSILYSDLDAFEDFISCSGLTVGGTGPLVRPIVACKGTVCTHGLADTQKIAAEMHERFYLGWHDVRLPHKFKIGIGGCPNNCVKPNINDLGIVAQRVPEIDVELCKSCNICADKCPMKCIKADGKAVIDMTVCNACGTCVEVCPFGAVHAKAEGFRIYIGGMWGKAGRVGAPINRLFTYDEVFKITERALNLFKEHANPGERFAKMTDRIGQEKVIEELLRDI